MRKPVFVLALLAVVVMAAAATVSSASAENAKNRDIVTTAVGAGQFTTLAALLKKAGLVGTLQRKGPFTVLAPTDAAFAKVPSSTLNALGADRAKLRSVLLYHVLAGKAPAAKVTTLRSATTLNGKAVSIRVRSGKVFVNGARVVKADVNASNGVIHVIDRVLIPR